MSISSKQKNLFSFFIFSLTLFAFSFNSFGQCGVHLKHVYTDKFPFSKIRIASSADMTGDGIADLVLTREADQGVLRSNRVFILPNNGNGTFGAPIILDPPSQMTFNYTIMVGKVNNDSLNDIVIDFNTASVMAFLNNGNGTFTAQPIHSSSGMGRAISFLDINNDGKGDYLGFNNDFRYSLGNGDGTFGTPTLLISGRIGYPGDFNGDGKIDFINNQNLYINQGNAVFTPNDVTGVINDYPDTVKDFNGDGKSDLILRTTTGFAVLLKTAASETSFSRTDYPASIPSGNFYALTGNFNGNSAPDVVFDIRFANRKIVYTNDGAGNFTSQEYPAHFGNWNSPYHEYIVNDFDNDGKNDVIMFTSGTSNNSLLLRDTTSFTFQKNVCNRPGQTRIVDFDNSNTTDYSFWNPATGNWSYQTSNESTLQTATVNWGSGSQGDIPAPGDFDGDGITDRAVYRNSTGTWHIRRSSNQTPIIFQFGLTGDKPAAADYDGDGISDLAVWRPSDGVWYIWHMGTQQFSAVQFGLSDDKPIPADFDGDLKTDVAVYRPSTGVWYYLKSSDGAFRAAQWGLSTDKPIPADFDGDGNADLVVYRESENNLYILKSYDNSFAGYNWGIAQDKPLIGDFDGDFVADFMVYRPSTKRWWSTTFFWGAIFGEDNVILTSSILRIE